uniref:Uncharacterized protein n=1 Tax=Pyxicephalus adspersus TaxID=30357 RepID=A0AAV2ZW88_PYXAD|nr:TPA: hypothetical protein GDO54_013813 [Pyxicephalus adspersus]
MTLPLLRDKNGIQASMLYMRSSQPCAGVRKQQSSKGQGLHSQITDLSTHRSDLFLSAMPHKKKRALSLTQHKTLPYQIIP